MSHTTTAVFSFSADRQHISSLAHALLPSALLLAVMISALA